VLCLNGAKPVCFILPPKCATRSIEKALVQLGGKAVSGRHGVNPSVLETYPVKVAAIRNPFDVLVSWYHYDAKGKKSGAVFGDYVRRQAEKSHYIKDSILPHAGRADVFIRYEDNIELQLNIILSDNGYPQAKLEHIGQAKDRTPYWDYYDFELRKFVEQKYAYDLIQFGYAYNG
jgi:hypothetical protein